MSQVYFQLGARHWLSDKGIQQKITFKQRHEPNFQPTEADYSQLDNYPSIHTFTNKSLSTNKKGLTEICEQKL